MTVAAATAPASVRPLSRFPTVVADLLADRLQTRVLAAVMLAHLVLVVAGTGGWECPLRVGLGIPCPGCGLSAGVLALLAGHPVEAVTAHPLAPLVVLVGTLLILCAALPAATARRVAAGVARIEGALPLDVAAAVLLLGFWLVRLASLASASFNRI